MGTRFGGPSLAFRPSAAISTGEGPSGVAYTEDGQAHVLSFISRSVARMNVESTRAILGLDDSDSIWRGNIESTGAIEFTDSKLPEDVERGRALF